jgi:hypothetical protein
MPTPSDLETKLTPAAKQALGELVDDYRDQLLLGAEDSASRLGDLREIAVHDIMASLNRQQSRLFGRSRSSVERILRVYLFFGVLVGGTGLGGFVVKELIAGRGFQERLTLMMTFAGLFLSTMAYLMLHLRRNRGNVLRRSESGFEPGDYGSYLALWRDIELALRHVVSVRLGESAANAPISRLLQSLEVERILSSDEQVRLRQFLQLRNSIAHGQHRAVGETDIALAARDAGRLLDRLRSLL